MRSYMKIAILSSAVNAILIAVGCWGVVTYESRQASANYHRLACEYGALNEDCTAPDTLPADFFSSGLNKDCTALFDMSKARPIAKAATDNAATDISAGLVPIPPNATFKAEIPKELNLTAATTNQLQWCIDQSAPAGTVEAADATLLWCEGHPKQPLTLDMREAKSIK